MELGLVTQSVQVTGEVPLLQTADSTVGNVVDQRRIENLPLNGRDFTQLTLLITRGSSGIASRIGLLRYHRVRNLRGSEREPA